MLRPDRLLVILALALAVGSVTLAVLGPRLLGEAINVVFDGVRVAATASTSITSARSSRVVVALNVGALGLRAVPGPADRDVVQRTVLRLRDQVQDKLSRLPLSYFDRQPRGEILSRVTNDIDNVQQSCSRR